MGRSATAAAAVSEPEVIFRVVIRYVGDELFRRPVVGGLPALYPFADDAAEYAAEIFVARV